jgi:hypothetical protein
MLLIKDIQAISEVIRISIMSAYSSSKFSFIDEFIQGSCMLKSVCMTEERVIKISRIFFL